MRKVALMVTVIGLAVVSAMAEEKTEVKAVAPASTNVVVAPASTNAVTTNVTAKVEVKAAKAVKPSKEMQ